MFSSIFIFGLKPLDEDFHRLNDEIVHAARQIPGFLGEEAWHNEEMGLYSEVYYWETREALSELMTMARHREAKALNDRWLDGYKVVIAEVERVYGEPGLGLEHVPEAAAD